MGLHCQVLQQSKSTADEFLLLPIIFNNTKPHTFILWLSRLQFVWSSACRQTPLCWNKPLKLDLRFLNCLKKVHYQSSIHCSTPAAEAPAGTSSRTSQSHFLLIHPYHCHLYLQWVWVDKNYFLFQGTTFFPFSNYDFNDTPILKAWGRLLNRDF